MKLSKEEVAWVVENEGLDYAICEYMGADSIADSELAEAWEAAKFALKRVVDLLPELGD